MATKRKIRTKKPVTDYIQFSKKLCVFISICWSIGRLLGLIILAYRPELGTAMIQYQRGLDDVMMINIGFYSGNSVAEKGIIGYFTRKAEKDEQDEQVESEGGNG